MEYIIVNKESFSTGGKLLVDLENHTVLIKHWIYHWLRVLKYAIWYVLGKILCYNFFGSEPSPILGAGWIAKWEVIGFYINHYANLPLALPQVWNIFKSVKIIIDGEVMFCLNNVLSQTNLYSPFMTFFIWKSKEAKWMSGDLKDRFSIYFL